MNTEKLRFKNSMHSISDRWLSKYAWWRTFHEVIGCYLTNGLACELMDPVHYEKEIGVSLTGIGAQDWKRLRELNSVSS